MQSTENWKPVVGYEGIYEVSDAGRVRSLARKIMRSNGAPQTVKERLLKQSNLKGYLIVRLTVGGVGKGFLVHRLVAASFLGLAEPGQEVCHADGTRTNNRVENLRWGTRSDNMKDAIKHGTHTNAAKTHCTRGHEFTEGNTRYFFKGERRMRVCITCRERKVPCPICGEDRTHYGMKSHLLWGHRITVKGRSWQTGSGLISKKSIA